MLAKDDLKASEVLEAPIEEYKKQARKPLLTRLEDAEKIAKATKTKEIKDNASCCYGPRNTPTPKLESGGLEEAKNEGKEKSYIQMLNRMDTIYMDSTTQSEERLQ